MQKYSAPLLRVALSLVFIWFAVDQFRDPETWSGFVPLWITDMGLSATMLVTANAVFEIVFGTLLLLGIFVRPVAFLLALHLAGITMSLGYNAIAVRDFGLSLATFAIALHGADAYSLQKPKHQS